MAQKTMKEIKNEWEQVKNILDREFNVTSLEEESSITEKKKIFKNKKRFSTSKIIMFFLFINCTFIEIFTCWATCQSINLAILYNGYIDFSPLITLIGTVVGEVIGFAIYALKAKAENTCGGITYLEAQHEFENIETDEEETIKEEFG